MNNNDVGHMVWYVFAFEMTCIMNMHHVMSCALVGVSDETIPEGIRCNIVCHVGPKAMITDDCVPCGT